MRPGSPSVTLPTIGACTNCGRSRRLRNLRCEHCGSIQIGGATRHTGTLPDGRKIVVDWERPAPIVEDPDLLP